VEETDENITHTYYSKIADVTNRYSGSDASYRIDGQEKLWAAGRRREIVLAQPYEKTDVWFGNYIDLYSGHKTSYYKGIFMKRISISNDIVPIGEFKTNISNWFKSIGNTVYPSIITQNSKSAGVLLSPKDYDECAQAFPIKISLLMKTHTDENSLTVRTQYGFLSPHRYNAHIRNLMLQKDALFPWEVLKCRKN